MTSPFLLIETRKYQDEIKDQHPWSGTLAHLYNLAHSRDIINSLTSLRSNFTFFETQRSGSDLVITMLDFLLDKVEDEKVDGVLEHMKDMVNEETGAKLMTLSQQLIQKGVRLVAKRLLDRGLTLREVQQLTELPLDTLKELQPHTIDD